MATLKAVRAQLIADLKPTLGKKFTLFPDGNTLRDSLSKPALVLTRTQVEKLAEAPLGFYSNSMTLTVIDNVLDNEDHLDDLLDDVLEALDGVNTGLKWESATRATYNDSNPAYQITLTVHSTRKAT